MLKISILDVSFKIIHSRLQLQFPGANELNRLKMLDSGILAMAGVVCADEFTIHDIVCGMT